MTNKKKQNRLSVIKGVVIAVVISVLAPVVIYLTTNQDTFTWRGFGIACAAGFATWLMSYLRTKGEEK